MSASSGCRHPERKKLTKKESKYNHRKDNKRQSGQTNRLEKTKKKLCNTKNPFKRIERLTYRERKTDRGKDEQRERQLEREREIETKMLRKRSKETEN